MIAAVGNTPYNIVLLVHILLAMVAFAPAFTHPFLAAQTKALQPESRQAVLGYLVANGRRVYSPALILLGLSGFALSGMSDQAYQLSQTWLLAAIVIWIAMNGVLHALVIPGERAMSQGDESASGKVDAGGAVLSVLLLIMLYLMIFKPGF